MNDGENQALTFAVDVSVNLCHFLVKKVGTKTQNLKSVHKHRPQYSVSENLFSGKRDDNRINIQKAHVYL